MPTVYFLIGIPGSGKTTWLKSQLPKYPYSEDAIVLSTDMLIEQYALWSNKTYNEVFQERIKPSENMLQLNLEEAIHFNKNVYYDQTNLTPKTRSKKMSKFPKSYRKEAIIFLTSEAITDIINEERKSFGRALPKHILDSMKQNFDVSTIEKEDFDKVTYIERN